MKQFQLKTRGAALLAALTLLAGCATTDMGRGEKTAIGAGAGAAVGAGLGALIGDSTKATLIGAGVGALAGGVAGYNWSGIKKDVEQSGATDLGVSVTEMPDGSLKVNLPSNVSFDVGKANLNPQLYPVLDSVARALVQHPELRAISLGFTDSTGSAQVNERLSLQRAQAVTRYLHNHGVNNDRLIAQGRGASDPIGDNATEAGRALNRRVELYLYAPK